MIDILARLGVQIRFLRSVFLFCLLLPVQAAPCYPAEILALDEFHPETTHLGVFNSFKYRLVLIALTQKNLEPFDCYPNRYIFYDYGNEDYFEIAAGNLKINSDYSKLIKTEIHAAVSMPDSDNLQWKEKINSIMQKMSVSSQTLENAKSISTDKAVFCWQQPVVVELPFRIERPFPLLAVNLCQHAWCSELYWTDADHVRFWVHINPTQYHLIQLNTQTGSFDYKDKSPIFHKKSFMQLNAPRDNIVTADNRSEGSFSLNSGKGNHIRLQWSTTDTQRIQISLYREKTNDAASQRILKRINEETSKKHYTNALNLIKFGFWLNPENKELSYQKLRIFGSLLLIDNFFKTFSDEFSKSEKPGICKKLKEDSALDNLRKLNPFNKRFSKQCP